jgi:hypothetical protein
VNLYLNIRDPKKAAMHLYLAGATNLIYAENSSSINDAKSLYSKLKLIRKRAEEYFHRSLKIGGNDPSC